MILRIFIFFENLLREVRACLLGLDRNWGLGSSVVIATVYGVDGPGI
jgi:hypothetical protein